MSVSDTRAARLEIVKNPVSYSCRLKERDPESIDTVVIHCTELPDPIICREFAERILYESGTGNCGHYYVHRDGVCVQYVELNRTAHHVAGHNETSIGVELINRGRYPYWFRSDHQELTQEYTEEQYETLTKLLQQLKRELPGLVRLERHSDLDRTMVEALDDPSIQISRKVDPGPLFDWKRIYKTWRTG